MRSLRAGRRQTFFMLEVPAALPVLLGGLKIGVTLGVIGAVVGEFVGADRGLGFLINLSKGLFNTPLMFAALIKMLPEGASRGRSRDGMVDRSREHPLSGRSTLQGRSRFLTACTSALIRHDTGGWPDMDMMKH